MQVHAIWQKLIRKRGNREHCWPCRGSASGCRRERLLLMWDGRLGIAFFNYSTHGLRDNFIQAIDNWDGGKRGLAFALLAVSCTCGTPAPALGERRLALQSLCCPRAGLLMSPCLCEASRAQCPSPQEPGSTVCVLAHCPGKPGLWEWQPCWLCGSRTPGGAPLRMAYLAWPVPCYPSLPTHSCCVCGL